jgi:hypothetical protein
MSRLVPRLLVPSESSHALGECEDSECEECRQWYRDQDADWKVDKSEHG